MESIVSLINVSEAAHLALHSLVIVAKNAPERITVKRLAEELDASQAHLAKVFQKLGKAGLVTSVRGPAGGFVLNRPATEISFIEIYEIIDGKINLEGCPLGKSSCPFMDCIFSGELRRITSELHSSFSKMLLSDYL